MYSMNSDIEVKCRTTKGKVREMKASFKVLKMESGVLLVDKLLGGLHSEPGVHIFAWSHPPECGQVLWHVSDQQ